MASVQPSFFFFYSVFASLIQGEQLEWPQDRPTVGLPNSQNRQLSDPRGHHTCN